MRDATGKREGQNRGNAGEKLEARESGTRNPTSSRQTPCQFLSTTKPVGDALDPVFQVRKQRQDEASGPFPYSLPPNQDLVSGRLHFGSNLSPRECKPVFHFD